VRIEPSIVALPRMSNTPSARLALVAEIAASHQVVFAHRGLGEAAPPFGRSRLETS